MDNLLLVPEESQSLVGEVSKFLNTVKLGHSKLQIEKFILNSNEYPTDFSKFLQAKLELWIRFEALIQSHYDFSKLDCEIELEEAKILKAREELESSDNKDYTKKRLEAEIKLAEVEKRNKEYRMLIIKKQVSEKVREMKVFHDCLKKYEQLNVDEEKEELAFWIEKSKTDPTGRLKDYLRGV